MVTSAPSRRFARALVAVALAGAASTLGGVAWADPSPDPAVVGDESPAPEAPVVEPSIGSWIIGGTLLEGSKPVAKPVVKPVVKPVAKPAARPVVKPVVAPVAAAPVRATTRHGTPSSRTASGARSAAAAATAATAATPAGAPGGATALPFTGGHVDALLPTGIALLVGGVVLTLATRPRRVPVRG